MAAFEILEHTADVGVIATGDTLAGALACVAQGMFSIIADLNDVESKDSITLSIESMDRDGLVVDWLNELLFTFESERMHTTSVLKRTELRH